MTTRRWPASGGEGWVTTTEPETGLDLERRALCRDRWHPERPDARPMVFRYLHRPHRPREVAARGHPVPQLVEVVPQLAGEHGDADGIHARCTAIGPDLLPRLNDEALVDLKR